MNQMNAGPQMNNQMNNQMNQQINNQPMKFCKFCGERIPADAVICTHCGRQVEEIRGAGVNRSMDQPVVNVNNNFGAFDYNESDKSKSTSVLLAALGFFGIAGIHRFYVGKPLSGLLWLCTGGLCGFGTLVDVIQIASGTFKDGAGRIVKK
jgi:TM2 domain-containing membrane protein YozV